MTSETMTAVVFDAYGPPDVLRLGEVPIPSPGPGEVRVRVKAAGVQPFDVRFRAGEMARYGMAATFPAQRLGQEYSGIVDAVGDGVTELRPGDAVLGSAMLAAAAQYVVIPAGGAVTRPDELDFAQAAALVAAAQTASGALGELAVQPGATLLVHAAAGAVGSLAVQLARLRGATVIGTASPANHDYLHGLGAVPVEYGDGLVERVRAVAPGGVDVALDAVGGLAIRQSAELVADRARIGTIVDDATAAEVGARVVRAGRSPARLAEVVALAARGEIVLPVRAYPLAQAAEAHRSVESRHGRGKVVLIVEP